MATIRGLKYPLQVVNGNLATSIDYDLKAQEILSVVQTRYFERVMRASYGVSDKTLDVINPGLINSEIQTSISQNVSGLTALSVQGDWVSEGDNGLYKVFIVYAVEGIPQPPLEFALAN